MARNVALQQFLRSRRARVQPDAVGIATDGRRRVPGLRREEVALLAGVSLDYYARLEQGRPLQPSDQVLDAIARALRLAEVERRHLHRLIRASATTPAPGALVISPLDGGLALMLDSVALPGMVVDVRGDVLAINRLGRAMLVGLDVVGADVSGRAEHAAIHTNHARWLFLDPRARALFRDWEMNARVSVGVLRDAAGRYPGDTALQALIGELTVASREFASWWAEHDVELHCRGLKRFSHPVVGELELQTETLALQDGNRWLYLYAAEPGSSSADALALLGSWAATQDAEAHVAGITAGDAAITPR